MTLEISGHVPGEVHPASIWPEARRLYQAGLSLQAVGQKLNVPYSTVRLHAWIEDWGIRNKGRGPDPRHQRARARQIRQRLEREEKRLTQELVLVKPAELEVLAHKNLSAASARTKLKVSDLINRTLEELAEPGVKPRDRAQGIGYLTPAMKLVYGWSREADMNGMKSAEAIDTSRVAINLALQAVSPAQMRNLRETRLALEGKPDRDRQPGLSARAETGSNAPATGSSVEEPEQPRTSPPVNQPKKEAPSSPVQEPAPSSRTVTKERVAPSLAAEQPVQGDPPFSPAAQQQEAQRAAFEWARAEHRRACWEKSRERGR